MLLTKYIVYIRCIYYLLSLNLTCPARKASGLLAMLNASLALVVFPMLASPSITREGNFLEICKEIY